MSIILMDVMPMRENVKKYTWRVPACNHSNHFNYGNRGNHCNYVNRDKTSYHSNHSCHGNLNNHKNDGKNNARIRGNDLWLLRGGGI